MIRGTDYSSTLMKRPGGGQIVELLDWAIKGGPAKWCDDVTYDADKTITQLFITARNFTINAGKTLTSTALRPLIVVADKVDISGTTTASGKGCSAVTSGAGKRCTTPAWPFPVLYGEEVSDVRNYCLCGSGGGASISSAGGGAFKAGGALGAVGNACDLTDAEIKELLFSPLFNIFQIGMGGSGASAGGGTSGAGAGLILMIAREIILAATASILANGLGTSNSCGAGGGGFVGLFGQSLSVDGAATVTASKGVASGAGFDGGEGATVQISV